MASVEKAEDLVHRRVVSSLQALAHPDWTNAVIGTAAAIALESAKAACATQLISEVRLPALTDTMMKKTDC